MAQQILAAFFVLALLAGTLWVLRRKGVARINLSLPKRAPGTRQMQILERLALTAQHSLYLIGVGERKVLLSVSPSGCNRILSLPNDSPPMNPENGREIS